MATENRQRAPQMRGGGNRMMQRFGKKEKPKNAKESIKRLFKYVSSNVGLLIAIITIVITYSVITILTNIFDKNIG